MTMLLFLLLAVTAFEGCVRHIQPYEARKRDYRPDYEVMQTEVERTPGSLWSTRDNSSRLFADHRANRIADIVVVRIEENSTANQSANTQLAKDSGIAAQITAMLGAMKAFQKANPDFDPSQLIAGKFKNEFEGGGSTSRAGKIIATVPAQIRKELPDGNLFIEGHRVVLVNDEEAHFYVSGLIRPYDIDKNNSVSSSVIADAQIEFTGRGVVTEKNNVPWGSRLLDYVWPF